MSENEHVEIKFESKEVGLLKWEEIPDGTFIRNVHLGGFLYYKHPFGKDGNREVALNVSTGDTHAVPDLDTRSWQIVDVAIHVK